MGVMQAEGWGLGVGEMSVQSMGGWRKIDFKTVSSPYLKLLTEGAITTEAGSLFLCFTTLTEKADPLLQRWLLFGYTL